MSVRADKKLTLRVDKVYPHIFPNKTHWMLKCIEYKYAKLFKEEGILRFSTPLSWVKENTSSRYDPYEGVYASMSNYNIDLRAFLLKLRPHAECFKKDGHFYFRSKEVMSSRCYCVYGLNDNMMHLQTKRSQDHCFHMGGIIPFTYFSKLFPEWNKEKYEKSDDESRPAVLLIRPDKFNEKLLKHLISLGIKKEEIMVAPVNYHNYQKDSFVIDKYAAELISKHVDYNEQSEIRYCIDTRRPFVKELFDASDGIIKIGEIDDTIASISDFYFEDMQVEIRGGHLLYSLATPRSYKIDDIDDRSILNFLHQALADELPGSPMTIKQIEAAMEVYLNVLKSRDNKMQYDRINNFLLFKGQLYDLGATAGYKMLEHYNNYIIDKDYNGAGATIEKFKHFFPQYDLGDYFKTYYDWKKGQPE